MDQETRGYIENIDSWIKEINQEIGPLKKLRPSLIEAHRNTQHNYELIYELKEDIEIIKRQIRTISLILSAQYKIQRNHQEEHEKVLLNLEPLLKDILVFFENGKEEFRGPRKESNAVRNP